MSRRKIPAALARKVRRQARYRCGYCLLGEHLIGMRMEFEHLRPLAAGGQTIEENLWLSCRNCNGGKHTQTAAQDPETGQVVPLSIRAVKSGTNTSAGVKTGQRSSV